MKHFATADFWACYRRLPADVRQLADKNFELLKLNPSHPSLQLKPVMGYWSVRVGLRYRALARDHEQGLIWFWVGSHAEYDRLLR